MAMKIFGTPTSPYVRKVRIVAGAIGLPIDFVDTRTESGAAGFSKVAPLGKMPVAVVEGPSELVLPDSSLIVNWIWRQHSAALLAAGWNLDPERWEDRALQIVVEGALDAAINRFYLHKDGFDDKGYIGKQRDRVDTALSWLDKQRITFDRVNGHWGLAVLSLGCALDWMVFRKAADLSRWPGLLAFRAAWTASGVGRGSEPG